MADFRCRLASPDGRIIERDISAPDIEAARREFERQDLLVLAIAPRSALTGAIGGMLRRAPKIPVGEFLVFNQEFAALIRAGLPIVEALTLLGERRKNPHFKAALVEVRNKVRSGIDLSEAFAQEPLFPPLYASSLAAGERSGEIASVLGRYIRYTQTLLAVKRKVVAAVTYPLILIALALVLVFVLLTYVLPKFEDFFRGFGTELPLLTRIVLVASTFLRDYALLWIPALFVAGALATAWRRTPAGRRISERLLYRTPVVGGIAQKFVVTRFARTMASLVAGGIPLPTALEILARSIGTPIYAAALAEVERKVREGGLFWRALEGTALFPDLLVEMVKVGESSGSLSEMLEHVADFTDQEIEVNLQRLVSLAEPLLLVFMAIVVGFLLLAIYYPLLQVYSNSAIG